METVVTFWKNKEMTETPPSWLNREFLEKALRSNGNNPNITVTSCEIKPATLAGDHYGSEMYRATLQTEDNGKSGEISVVVKCKVREGELSKLTDEMDIFMKEARAFIDIHIPMRNMLKDAFADNFQPFAAKCIYTNIKPEAIILEDLKKEGFRLATITHGLDLKHCLLVMKTIAQYHAASLVLRREDPRRLETFMETLMNKNPNNGIRRFLTSTLKSAREEIAKWTGYEHHLDKLNILENTAMDHWVDAYDRDEEGFNVLIHGDLWKNNMMFRYSEDNGEVQDVRLVDFQLPYVTSPAIDLHYFMNSSASPDVLENHRHVLVDEYYNRLCETLSKLGHEDLQPTKDTLNSELEKKQLLGAIAGISLRTVVLADINHVPDMEDVLKNNQTLYLSKSYKEVIKKLLPLYEKWGWLKV